MAAKCLSPASLSCHVRLTFERADCKLVELCLILGEVGEVGEVEEFREYDRYLSPPRAIEMHRQRILRDSNRVA